MAAALIIAFCIYMKSRTIIKDGEVYESWARIADEKYVRADFETLGRSKIIAEIDGWGVYELKEDPSYIFLHIKSFTSDEYAVKEKEETAPSTESGELSENQPEDINGGLNRTHVSTRLVNGRWVRGGSYEYIKRRNYWK